MIDQATQRMDELESRLAFQDDLIENLNQVVSRQDKEIIELKLRLIELVRQVKDLEHSSATSGPASEFETPPHY
jgi:SlyX protein